MNVKMKTAKHKISQGFAMKTLLTASLVFTSMAFAQLPVPPELKNENVLKIAKTVGTQVAAACQSESVQFCKEKKMDKLKACLQANYGKLSDGCKAALKPAK